MFKNTQKIAILREEVEKLKSKVHELGIMINGYEHTTLYSGKTYHIGLNEKLMLLMAYNKVSTEYIGSRPGRFQLSKWRK